MLSINKIDFFWTRGWRSESLDRNRKKTQEELLMLDLIKEKPKARTEEIVMLWLKEIKYVNGGEYGQEKHRLQVSQYKIIMNSSNKIDLEDYIFALPRNNDSMFTIIINPHTNNYELWTIEWEEAERFSDEFWEN